MKKKIPLPQAKEIAQRVVGTLAPFLRPNRGGRKHSPPGTAEVGDIEIVCQAKMGRDLFGQEFPLPIPTDFLGHHAASGERYRKIFLTGEVVPTPEEDNFLRICGVAHIAPADR